MMDSERWKQINEIFHAALDREPSARSAFLAEACKEDDSLRVKIESLIASHEKESSLFETPASDLAAELLNGGQAGTIAHYKVLKRIGSGGMGEVYLAEDTRLNRNVALKLLPREFSQDKDRIRRFEREARAVSALNHPYILTIYDIGRIDSSTFIASEFIDGETLRERMRKSKIPLKEIMSISIQVAEALDAAHCAGIIHRDIKPENIMLRKDGYAKVLDFGLAKLMETPEVSQTSALETLSKTEKGIMLGTLRYMSPEQARGLNLDVRSDLFSMGVVLYEMITGQVPFDGETPSDVLVAILEKQPPPLDADIPDELKWIVTKALAKDADERYQTAKDLLADLKRIRRTLETEEVLRLTGRQKTDVAFNSKKAKISIAVIGAAVLVAAIIGFQIRSKKPSPPLNTKSLDQKQKQITFSGNVFWSAISPDGKFIAFFQSPGQILVQSMKAGEPIPLSIETGNVRDIRWSPDGSELLVANESKKEGFQLLVVNPFGGQPRSIKPMGIISCWSPDSLKLASTDYPAKYIRISSIREPEKSVLTKTNVPFPFVFIHDLDWSTNGRFALIISTKTQSFITTMKEDGSQPQVIASESLNTIRQVRWSWDSTAIYYSKEGQNRQTELMKVEVSPENGKAIGKPKLILSQQGKILSLNISRTGTLATTRWTSKSNLWTLALTDSKKQWSKKQITTGTWSASFPAVSPDGKSIVFSLTKDNTSIFTIPINGGPLRQLTFEDKVCNRPVWSPSGNTIAATCNDDGVLNVFLISPEGSILKQFRSTKVSSSWHISWAPSNSILYQQPDNRNFKLLDPETGKETSFLADDSRGWIFDPLISPNQKKAAIRVNWPSKSARGIWVEDLSEHAGELLIPNSFADIIGWSSDSRWLYFMQEDDVGIYKINIDTKKKIALPPIDLKGIEWGSMSADEKTFVAEVSEHETDVWITENFDRDGYREEE